MQTYLAENDDWLISRFRLPRPLLLYLCNILEAKLRRETRRSSSIPAHLQVLSMLVFLATGTFQWEIADRTGISQSSMSRIIPDVLDGPIRLLPQYIKFPYNLVHQLEVKQRFFAIANLPNVIGAIDCTHIRFKAPSHDAFAFAFLNRKNYHSINVQLICDANCALLNVVDSDSGYPLTPWLMTPLINPQSRQELAYNEAHAKTKSVIERTILKGHIRWYTII